MVIAGGDLRKAVFLDRDGVLNRAVVRDGRPFAPKSLEEFEICPSVPKDVKRLRDGGYLTIVATNQPDVGRGVQSRDVVEAMHKRLRECADLDDIKVCYHSGELPCACRKPKPGMLLEAAQEWGIDLATSFMVGDRWRDVEAGKAAGCRTIFIDHGYDEPRGESDWVVRSFCDAVDKVLQQRVTK